MPNGIEAPASITAEGQTSHTPNQLQALAKLRVPFPKDQINPLPKITCGKCSKSPAKECDSHRKSKCRECGNWITGAHMHLDYVGHAELTNRLLDADPFWDWEPLALDERGLPVFDGYGGLWIRLTVCGHSRLGYGDSQGKTGPNAIKEAIGDALRNAAMRFGAALDLWAKSDLKAAQAEHPKSADDDVRPTSPPGPTRQEQPGASSQQEAAGPQGLEELKEKVNRGWHNVLACEQNLHEARRKNLHSAEVPVGEQTVRVEDLLTKRIKELKAAAQGGAVEGQAA